MKISLEQMGKVRERRQQVASRRGSALGIVQNRWVQPLLLTMGVLFVVALVADLVNVQLGGAFAQQLQSVPDELQQLARDCTGGQRVKADSGLFSFVLPAGWMLRTGEVAAPYDLTLISPNRVCVSMSAARVPFDDLPALFKAMSQREREYNVRTEPQTFFLHGIPAARREVQLFKSHVLVVDFVKDRVAHQIFCDVPPELFDSYRPALLKFIETYQPLPQSSPPPKSP